MSLIACPECGHEVSTTATACPNCGRPITNPELERNVVVREVRPVKRDDFPKWIFIPLGILGVVVLFLLFYLLRSDDEANRNINVNVSQRRSANDNTRDTTTTRSEPPNQINVPPSSTDSSTVTVPPQNPPSVTTVPGDTTTVANDRGNVTLEAKISTRSGGIQPVRAEKFYLLDEDLESILSDAKLEDDSGQGLRNAFGLAVLYPDRYRENYQKAMNAIKKHIKYDMQTDASGKAQKKDIKPDSYYLFGITKTRNGFAIWSSPVTITGGENVLNLSPESLTEVQE